jgi:hypothetical protein
MSGPGLGRLLKPRFFQPETEVGIQKPAINRKLKKNNRKNQKVGFTIIADNRCNNFYTVFSYLFSFTEIINCNKLHNKTALTETHNLTTLVTSQITMLWGPSCLVSVFWAPTGSHGLKTSVAHPAT